MNINLNHSVNKHKTPSRPFDNSKENAFKNNSFCICFDKFDVKLQWISGWFSFWMMLSQEQAWVMRHNCTKFVSVKVVYFLWVFFIGLVNLMNVFAFLYFFFHCPKIRKCLWTHVLYAIFRAELRIFLFWNSKFKMHVWPRKKIQIIYLWANVKNVPKIIEIMAVFGILMRRTYTNHTLPCWSFILSSLAFIL